MAMIEIYGQKDTYPGFDWNVQPDDFRKIAAKDLDVANQIRYLISHARQSDQKKYIPAFKYTLRRYQIVQFNKKILPLVQLQQIFGRFLSKPSRTKLTKWFGVKHGN